MKKRYVIYLCLLLMIIFGFGMFGLPTQPVLPVIQMPGEAVIRNIPLLGSITNTFIATIITYLLIVILVSSLKARSRTADEVPTGFYNLFEMIIEFAYGFVEGAAGKWAPKFFPFFMTFALLIITANWLELVPGVDSIGKWESMGELRAHQAEAAAEAEASAAGVHLTEEDLHHIAAEAEMTALDANQGNLRRGLALLRASADADGNKPEDADWTIVPFVRVPATDLNFTIGLAIISVVMTQYYGIRALGIKYFKKFLTFDAEGISKNPLGLMDTVVGIIELMSEVFKIISFAFRLLGNIFAGQVLLFVIGFLAPVALVAVYGLEFFVGAIQAVVFGMLTLSFMSGATVSHDHAEEHH
jgi:F-type H+-transporting ATPase subunit a